MALWETQSGLVQEAESWGKAWVEEAGDKLHRSSKIEVNCFEQGYWTQEILCAGKRAANRIS